MNKSLLLIPIFAVLLIFSVSFDSSDALKSQGTKTKEIGSDKVCGDKLCSEIQESEIYQQGIAQKLGAQKSFNPIAVEKQKPFEKLKPVENLKPSVDTTDLPVIKKNPIDNKSQLAIDTSPGIEITPSESNEGVVLQIADLKNQINELRSQISSLQLSISTLNPNDQGGITIENYDIVNRDKWMSCQLFSVQQTTAHYRNDHCRISGSSSIQWSNISLENYNLSGADFTSLVPSESPDLRQMTWSNAILSGADFSGTTISHLTDKNVNLSGADFSGAVLKDTSWESSNFSHAKFIGTSFDTVKFFDSDMFNVDFRDATVSGIFLVRNSDITGADFRGVTWTNSAPDFNDSNLTAVNFSGADLRGASFVDTILTSTNFNGADISDVDFSGCIGQSIGQPRSGQLPDCELPPVSAVTPKSAKDFTLSPIP